MTGASVTKNRWIIWCNKEYCLESNDSIWEKKEKPPPWIKVWKKAKALW